MQAARQLVRLKQYSDWLPLGLVLLLTLYSSGFYLTLDGEHLAFHHEDDVSYYFQIAKNLTQHGEVFTFDRIHRTNGFHPLWMMISAAGIAIFESPEMQYRAMFAFQYLLFLCIAGLLYAILKIVSRSGIVATFLTLFFSMESFFKRTVITGLETPVFIFLLLLCFYTLLRIRVDQIERYWAGALGSLLALIVFSRLDAGMFFSSLFVFYLAFYLRGLKNLGRIKPILACWLSPIAFFSVLSFATCGTVFPISGLVRIDVARSVSSTSMSYLDFVTIYNWKTIFALKLSSLLPSYPELDVYYVKNPLLLLSNVALSLVVLGFFLASLPIRALRKHICALWLRNDESVRDTDLFREVLLLMFVTGSSLIPILYKILYSGATVPYYYTTIFSIAQIVAFARIFRVTQPLRFWMPPPLLGGVFFAALALPHWMRNDVGLKNRLDSSSGYTYWYDAAKWIDANLPADAVISGFNSGILAYFSNRRTVNLDGKVNSLRYLQHVMRAKDPWKSRVDFMKEAGVGYFVDRVRRHDIDKWAKLFSRSPDVELVEIKRFPGEKGVQCILYRLRYMKDYDP